MTNFEYYKKEILEMCNAEEDFTLSLDGKIVSCENKSCDCCKFKGFNCNLNIMKWLYEEHNEQPKLTKKERQFCELVETGWISRSEYQNCLAWTKEKPSKCKDVWIIPSSYYAIDLNKTMNLDFSFITWEDEEPWSVEELLKLEVEE